MNLLEAFAILLGINLPIGLVLYAYLSRKKNYIGIAAFSVMVMTVFFAAGADISIAKTIYLYPISSEELIVNYSFETEEGELVSYSLPTED